MVGALDVANNVLRLSFSDGFDVSPMKLQKLLYFVYKRHIKETGRPLFSERFEPWRYGPVLSSVYGAFKRFGTNHINAYYKDCNGDVWLVDEDGDTAFRNSLHAIWNKYKSHGGIHLSSLTHKKGSAWDVAVQGGHPFLSDTDIAEEEWF